MHLVTVVIESPDASDDQVKKNFESPDASADPRKSIFESQDASGVYDFGI